MSKKSWLCRDIDGDYAVGVLSRPVPISDDYGVWHQYYRNRSRIVRLCADEFKREFPNLKLKPGEGPRRVEFTGRFCDE